MSGGPIADNAPEDGFEYDLIVIGGGSGGLSVSKEAASLGKKVAVFDFVKPSPQGSSWGLGGTCVNVGCIPKKLMHTAGLLGGGLEDAKAYGWQVPDGTTHNWGTMVEAIQDHIGSLNWGYKVQLRDKNVTYKQEYAEFLDPHTIQGTDKKGRQKQYTARRFVVACGGRPSQDDVVDPSLYITSDDLFSLQEHPGKTLVIGASYVALECAGFITHIGGDATVMMRSIPLRGFDQQCSNMIVDYMEGMMVNEDGDRVSVADSETPEHRPITNFLKGYVVDTVTAMPDGKKKVTWKSTKGDLPAGEGIYDTILYAIGREACTGAIGLDKVGVEVQRNGKMITTCEQTNVPHVYAIGDVIYGQLELTPVAIQAGKLLARRLFAGSTMQMDYDQVPTTVFTPIEYGCTGLAEEDAIAKYGEENIETFHSFFKPLEWQVPHKQDNACYMKMICNKLDSFRVIGFHVLGPNAGEVNQGVGVAIKCGATKEDFDNTVGIHPTIAEEMCTLDITKSSGETAQKSGC